MYECLGKFTELCGRYGVTCTHGNCSSDTLGGMSRICWTLWYCIQHNENSMYAGLAKTITGSVPTRVRLGKEDLSFVEEFRYLGHIMTADCRDDKYIKKQFRRQNAVGNMLVRKFSFASIEAKIQLFKSYCYPIYGCALWRHSYQNSIRKLTVSYSDTFKHLIGVPRCTSSSLAFAMNATDHINEVFHKFAYSLMNRVMTPPTVLSLLLSIEMHIISLHWWISGKVCYKCRIDRR